MDLTIEASYEAFLIMRIITAFRPDFEEYSVLEAVEELIQRDGEFTEQSVDELVLTLEGAKGNAGSFH